MENLFYDLFFDIENLSPIFMVGAGVLLGILHAFEPDHIAAVGTQLIKSKNYSKKNLITSTFTKSSLIGIFWGAGHSTTILTIGILSSFLAISIQTEIFSKFELIVGGMLILLGILTIKNKNFLKIKHKHPHTHSDGRTHYDVHDHNTSEHNHGHKSYLIGLIHGLAGSGSVIALTTIYFENIEISLLFFLLFGLGSIIGMSVVSGLIGLPFIFYSKTKLLNKLFRNITGLVTIILGLTIFFQIGLTNFF